MILGAGLLLLVGLGLLVAGVLTGITALYWACVAACLVAAVLLVLVRRQIAGERAMAERVMAERSRDRATGRRSLHDERSEDRTPAAHRVPDRAPEPRTTVIPPPAAEPQRVHEPRVHEADEREAAVREAAVREAAVRQAEVRQSEVRHADARRSSVREAGGEPPLEEVEVTDLLLIMDLRDEVLVVDEHPRYHLSGCSYLDGVETFPLPIDEARSDGFSPCGSCAPDRHLAQRARQRR